MISRFSIYIVEQFQECIIHQNEKEYLLEALEILFLNCKGIDIFELSITTDDDNCTPNHPLQIHILSRIWLMLKSGILFDESMDDTEELIKFISSLIIVDANKLPIQIIEKV